MAKKIFLDANMLMEIMFARSKMESVTAVLHDAKFEFFMSTLTVHILYYFAESEGIDRSFVRRLAGLVAHLPVSKEMVAVAQERYDSKDFEDCLQAACAELGGCQEILTLDKNFAKNSSAKLPVQLVA